MILEHVLALKSLGSVILAWIIFRKKIFATFCILTRQKMNHSCI